MPGKDKELWSTPKTNVKDECRLLSVEIQEVKFAANEDNEIL